jgi:hypothetical protein
LWKLYKCVITWSIIIFLIVASWNWEPYYLCYMSFCKIFLFRNIAKFTVTKQHFLRTNKQVFIIVWIKLTGALLSTINLELFATIMEQNLSNRQKPGCGKGSAVDRSREQTTG